MKLSQLCTACGLCCDGSLFRFVPADEGEREKYARLGLPLVQQSGCTAMALPCRRLSERKCGVYEERPSTCRAYVCRLGDDLQRGKVAFAEALAVVREAQRRIAALQAAFPAPGPVVQSATSAALRGDPSLTDVAYELLSDVRTWIDERMHWPDDGQLA
ncbi:MAG: YkgJ family cysteine cluster protein [Myxococcota bacterium]